MLGQRSLSNEVRQDALFIGLLASRHEGRGRGLQTKARASACAEGLECLGAVFGLSTVEACDKRHLA